LSEDAKLKHYRVVLRKEVEKNEKDMTKDMTEGRKKKVDTFFYLLP